METIIKSFSEHGTLVQPDTLEYILSQKDPRKFTTFITDNLKEYPLVLTVNHIKDIEKINNQNKEKTKEEDQTLREKEIQSKMLSKIYEQQLKPQPEIELDFDDLDKEDQIEIPEEIEEKRQTKPITIKKVKSWKPISKEYDPEIEIIKDITGKSICEGNTTDFNKLFKDRFNSVKKILKKQRREMANTMPINRIKKTGVKEIQFVGIVNEVRNTRNGHRLIIIEDETDEVACIALKQNRDSFNIAQEVILDEIIGINGKLSKNGDLMIVDNIVYPDISIQNEKHKAEIPVYAAFLSDIHMGSKKFMQDQWNAFLKWINGQMGNSRQRDVAGKIKYIVIPGDVADGIGIYPNQEQELEIVDVYRQYETLAEQLRNIPDHISIIMQPGNHDAVRPAEPQPTFEKEIQDLFTDMDITFVGNPCYFSLNKVEILSYHGQSLLDYATNIQHLKYNQPVETMKVMLRKHHLAPTYGGYTPLAPEHMDYMVIDRIPDVFVTGHVHLAQIGDYRGVTLLNASSWQEQTTYQKMLNFIPDSAKLPIVDLKTSNVTMMDFNNNK